VLTVPAGSEAEMVNALADWSATTSESETDLVWAGLPLSVTVTVKFVVPVAVAVPEIKPVVGDMLSPAGRLPAVMDQLYGVVPPPAATAFEYAVPCVPEGKLDVVMVKAVDVGGTAAIDRVTVAVAVLSDIRLPAAALESVTLTPKE
jgi:hypothetical protein